MPPSTPICRRAARALCALLAFAMTFAPVTAAYGAPTPLADIPIAAKITAKPNVIYTLDQDRGEYQKGRHEVKFGNYPRYVGDAADMARIIRGEKECDFPYEHDLAVQEAVLLASGLPTT